MKILSAALMLCFGLFGCRGVTPSDVAGTWVVKDESRKLFLTEIQQKAVAKIMLNANGTFFASEIPADILYAPEKAGVGIVSGNGVWKLIAVQSRQLIQLNFEKVTAGKLKEIPFGTQLNVSDGSAHIRLFYFQGGDADQGRRIEFERVNE